MAVLEVEVIGPQSIWYFINTAKISKYFPQEIFPSCVAGLQDYRHHVVLVHPE
ncbi:hypothetical protein KSS87_007285, partial [Heliosperma pusillum]